MEEDARGERIVKVLSKNSKFLSKLFDEKKNGIRIIGQAAPRPNPIADDESIFFSMIVCLV